MRKIGRWCAECGQYVSLDKYTQKTTKNTQKRCDVCLGVDK